MATPLNRGSITATFYGADSWSEKSYNTFNDWQCFVTDKVVDPPELEKYIVDIPGRSGILDLSESLYGAPVYKNRNVKIELTTYLNYKSWSSLYNDIVNAVHGKVKRLLFSDESNYTYKGRVTVEPIKTDKGKCVITINVDCEPFKIVGSPIGNKFVNITVNRSQTTIPGYGTSYLYFSEDTTVTVNCSMTAVIDFVKTAGTFSTGKTMRISIDNQEYELTLSNTNNKSHELPAMLSAGSHTIRFHQVQCYDWSDIQINYTLRGAML